MQIICLCLTKYWWYVQRNSLYCILLSFKKRSQFLFYTEKQMATKYTSLYAISHFLLIKWDSFQYLTEWKTCFYFKLDCSTAEWHREAFDTGTAWANQGWCTAGSALHKPGWAGWGWPWQPWLQWPEREVFKNLREMTKKSSTAHKSGLWKRCYGKHRHLWLNSKVLIESRAK